MGKTYKDKRARKRKFDDEVNTYEDQLRDKRKKRDQKRREDAARHDKWLMDKYS